MFFERNISIETTVCVAISVATAAPHKRNHIAMSLRRSNATAVSNENPSIVIASVA